MIRFHSEDVAGANERVSALADDGLTCAEGSSLRRGLTRIYHDWHDVTDADDEREALERIRYEDQRG